MKLIFLLFFPAVVFSQDKRFIAIGAQYFPANYDVYIPKTGIYASYGETGRFSIDILLRSDIPRKNEWPGVGKFNMVNSHLNLLGSLHIPIVKKERWDIDFKLGMGISFISVRRIMTKHALKAFIAPYTYKKTGFTGIAGVEGNWFFSRRFGVNAFIGVGAYILKTGIINRF